MTFWGMLAHMFNGNETARSMRYSLSVIALILFAGYMGIVTSEIVSSIITLATGYIMGKARNDTHIITGASPDRRVNTSVGQNDAT